MALAGVNRGTGGNITTSTTLAVVPASSLAAGSTAVLAVAYDNAGGGGADPFSSITDNGSNPAWVRSPILNDPGAASAGVAMQICVLKNLVSLTTSNTITITFGTNVTAKSWTLTEITSTNSAYGDYTSANGLTGTGTIISQGFTATSSGNLLFYAAGAEGSSTITGDSDTTNGTWSSAQQITNGTGLTGMQIISQYKALNASGSQNVDVTFSTSQDWALLIIEFFETSVAAFTSIDAYGSRGYFGL